MIQDFQDKVAVVTGAASGIGVARVHGRLERGMSVVAAYVVSKGAALSLTECLALDLSAVGSKIGASVLTPSTFATGIAHTARVRPERFGRDATADGKGVVQALVEGRFPGFSEVD